MNILIITLKDPGIDPRPYKQIMSLSKNHTITVVGRKKITHPGVVSYEISYRMSYLNLFVFFILNQMRLYDRSYRIFSKTRSLYMVEKKLLETDFDWIITHDIDTLPFAMDIKKNAKLILDSHEYSPRQHDNLIMDLLFKKFRVYFFNKYLKKCDLMLAVSEGIAEEYLKNFGVSPLVITNASPYKELSPRPVDPEHIRIIHHGDTSPARKLEKMIDVMNYTEPRFSLYFMLIKTDTDYLKTLIKMAENMNNVHFIDPVPMNRIVDTINQYDIGLYLLEPYSFNALMALPNKIFEFVQARLAIVIAPAPEMAYLVKKYNLGVVTDDFLPGSMATLLNSLTAEDIQYFKEQSNRSAYILSSEKNDEILSDYLNKSR